MQTKVVDRYGQEILVGSNVLVTARSRHSGLDQRVVDRIDIKVDPNHRSYVSNPAFDPTQPHHYKHNPARVPAAGPATLVQVKVGRMYLGGSILGVPTNEIKIHEVIVIDKLL